MADSTKSSPLVTVVLSLYQPNLEYLAAQLDSINRQDYPHLELLVLNDNPLDADREVFINAHVTRFPVHYIHGEINRGYVKAFEKLILEASGQYLALCDQDDIWLPNRISACMALFRIGCKLVCCDRSVIDKNGSTVVESWRLSHPNEVEVNWTTGQDITVQAAFRCFSIGMATMVESDAARQLVPFPKSVGHDYWLALGLSELGSCGFIDYPLVKYRIHGMNQTSSFKGVASKKDWYESRVMSSREAIMRFAELFPASEHLEPMLEFSNARERHSAFKLIKLRRVSPQIALFEALMVITPNWLFRLAIKLLAAGH